VEFMFGITAGEQLDFQMSYLGAVEMEEGW